MENGTPFKSFNASHIISEASPYRSSFIGGAPRASALPPKGAAAGSPCKVRLANGDSRPMTQEEIRNKYLAYVSTSQSSVPFKKIQGKEDLASTYSQVVARHNPDVRSRSAQSAIRHLIPQSSNPASLGETHLGIVSWFNKEEEWWFTNKRLIFATKQADVADEWVTRFTNLLSSEPGKHALGMHHQAND